MMKQSMKRILGVGGILNSLLKDSSASLHHRKEGGKG